jgi:curli biogenesis system outer membrane secretion channel CsgG
MRFTWSLLLAPAFVVCHALGALGAAEKGPGKPTVAVFDFEVGPKTTITKIEDQSRRRVEKQKKTNLLTNKLITELTSSNEITVVERKRMATIMEEAELSKSDLTDPEKATEVGKLLGADYMLFGSISMYNGGVEVKQLPYDAGTQRVASLAVGADTRLVSSETGKVETASSLSAKRTKKDVNRGGGGGVPPDFEREVVQELARKVAQRVVNTLRPIKVAAVDGETVYLNRGGLERGAPFDVVKLGEVIRDPETGEVLGQTEQRVARIKVTAGLKKMSKAELVEWVGESREIPDGSICRMPRDEEED